MRKNRGIVFFMSAIVAGMFLGSASTFAQPQGGGEARPQAAIRTGVVDMLSLMRAHPKLNADLKEFNTKRMQKANELMARERALQEESKVLMQTLKVNGPDFSQKNDEMMKKKADLELEAAKASREFGIADIQMKYAAFKSIREEIQNFAGTKGFAVVIDYRTIDEEADELSNAEVEVTQPVVWCHQQIILTPYIVHALNKRYANYPPAAQVDNTGKITFLNNTIPGAPETGGAPQIQQRPQPGTQPQQGLGALPQPGTQPQPGAQPRPTATNTNRQTNQSQPRR